jgi:hypothetical protein
LTGFAASVIHAEAEQFHVVYPKKPFDPNQLVETVSEMPRKRS